MADHSSPKKLPISHALEVRPPVSEQGFTVSDSDWGYLRKKIAQISNGDIAYHTVGSISLGVAGSAFVAALSLPENTIVYGAKSSLLCWGLVSFFSAFGVMALVFSTKQRKVMARTKEDALEEMKRIEERCKPSPSPSPSPSPEAEE